MDSVLDLDEIVKQAAQAFLEDVAYAEKMMAASTVIINKRRLAARRKRANSSS